LVIVGGCGGVVGGVGTGGYEGEGCFGVLGGFVRMRIEEIYEGKMRKVGIG
jgi:hypothetical protein